MSNFHSFEFSKGDWFSSIMSKEVEWPNFIFDVNPSLGNDKEKIKQLISEIEKQEKPSFLILEEKDEAKDFICSIKQQGYLKVMSWPGMCLPVADNSIPEDSDNNFHIIEIEQPEDIKNWVEIVNKTLFRNIGLNPLIFSKLLDDEKISCILAYSQHKPVGTLLMHINEFDCMGIYMVSTLEEYREKGCMKSLMKYAIKQAQMNKIKHIVLEANNLSFKSYSKLGFETICNYTIFWKPIKK